jgi:hypothetical protein
MDTYTDKKGDKAEYDENAPTIRIILKSQETKNLDFVSNKIIVESLHAVRVPTPMIDSK